ncbi:MAG: hypothetical protein L3J33_03335 [Rhodobacteraceae bacterium]|nr:hypothetical protein [Paracoccaceae bacterium]
MNKLDKIIATDARLRELKRDRNRYARRTELGTIIGDAVMLGCIFAAGLIMLWVLT